MKALLLVVFIVSLGFSDDFKIASDAYTKKEYAKALKHYKIEADKGNSAAQYNVGLIYAGKLHVLKNAFASILSGDTSDKKSGYEGIKSSNEESYKLAMKYFKLAYKNGQEDASWQLGNLYLDGVSVPFVGTVVIKADGKQAKEWFMKATQAKDKSTSAVGEINLANMYHKGNFVLQDYSKAITHYKRAVKLGDTRAKCFLGEIYIAQGKSSKAKRIVRSGYEDGQEYCAELWTEHGLGVN